MRIPISIYSIIGLFAILLSSACTMSVKPEMKQNTDKLLAAYKTKHQTIDAANSYQPNPWQVGQWTVYRQTDAEGNVSHIKYAIVAKDECGFWLEVDNQSYYGRNIQKICYSSMPAAMAYDNRATSSNYIDSIQVIVTKSDNNKPQVMDFRTADEFTRKIMKTMGLTTGLKLYLGPDMPQEDRTVVAGKFLKTFHINAKLNAGPLAYQANIWSHPVVPITGQVYSKSVDGKYTTELLSYGEQGAQSVLLTYP